MGQGRPLHVVALHVFALVFRAAVAADKNHLKLIVFAVAEFDEAGGEAAAGRTPLGGEVEADDFAFERGEFDFVALGVDEVGTQKFLEGGEDGEGDGEKEGEEEFHFFGVAE